MSYILDALRKADAQRHRDPALGIHAQPVPLPAGRAKAGVAVLLLWGALAVGAASLLTAWYLSAPPAETLAAAPVPTPVFVPPAASTMPPPAPVAAQILPPAPVAAPAVAAPTATQRRGPILDVPRDRGALPAASRPPGPVAPAAPAAAETSASATNDNLPKIGQLPADVQGSLPKLAITGGVYSENPGQRMLIVNGQVFNEGAEPAPGVLLEQIRPNSAVLTFRGHRYTVAY
jgi:general secretion pathway protein B